MYTYKLSSHPDKLLKDHLINVYKIGEKIYQRNNFEEAINFEVLKTILLLHDFGKASEYFQDKLFKTKDHNINLTYHADISALICFLYLEENGFSVNDKIHAFLAIKKHHSNFSETLEDLLRINESKSKYFEQILKSINWQEIQEIYDPYLNMDFFDMNALIKKTTRIRFRKYRKELQNILKSKKCLDSYFRQNLYFSILITADKQDCIFNTSLLNKNSPDVNFNSVNTFKKTSFNSEQTKMNQLREEAYQEVLQNIDSQNNIFSINLPTGAGKTLTALNTALQIQKKDASLKRIIYCLPFTSIIDQNADVFQKVLNTDDNSILLKHHHLSEFDYQADFFRNEITTPNQAEYLIENWESRVIVTTFFQLLHTVLSGSNRMLKKFHAIMNSVIILDEVQSIPRKYWGLINQIFKYLTNHFNVKFLLVTATMPLLFSEEKNEIKELAISKKRYFQSMNRIILDASLLKKEQTLDEFKEHLLKDIEDNQSKSFLIILNTIKSSLNVFQFLQEKYGEDKVLYLSSNVIPKHRLERIHSVKSSKERTIVVSTQVVEAGVDIDFDVVYRDIAPLDSIFQACGRCNRHGEMKSKGVVKLVKLIEENGTPYSKYVYDSVNLHQTNSLLSNESIIEEKDFFALSHKYFKAMKNATENDTSNNLLGLISCLNYEKSFYSEGCFQLIDNDYETVSLFVEIDNEATLLLKGYYHFIENLSETPNDFESKTAFKNHVKKMSQYIINVPKKFLKEAEDSQLYIVDKSQLLSLYNKDTGFIRDMNAKDFIF